MEPFQRETYHARWPFTVSAGVDSTIPIPMIGDVIDSIYLRFSGPFPNTVPTSYGTTLVNFAELSYQSNVIERVYGETLFIMNDLTVPQGKRASLTQLVGLDINTPLQEYYVKLTFSVPLPLCALHEAPMLRVVFAGVFGNVDYLIDYVFLKDPERNHLLNNRLEYLTQYFQVLDFGYKATNHLKVVTSFVNSVKEIFWVLDNGEGTYSYVNDMKQLEFSLNGVQYLNQTSKYFHVIQPLQNHTKVPNSNIYSYSFALRPQDFQPSGEVNLSNLTNQQHILTLGSQTTYMRIYALTYNVCTINNGVLTMKHTVSPSGFKP